MNPEELEALYRSKALPAVATQIPPDDPRLRCNLLFAGQRLREGVEIDRYLHREFGTRRLRILDVGAGAGGVSLGLANAGHHVFAIDVVVNPVLRDMTRRTMLPVRCVVARAEALPFKDGVFDVVLCLDTIEHLPDVAGAGREMMRLTRHQVMLTTPPRMRYLLRPDPHFGIRGLLMLPDRIQRLVVEKWLKCGEYDIQHTYWRARSLLAAFPSAKAAEIMIATPWPPPPRRTASQILQLVEHHFWKRLRHVLWSRNVIYKR